MSERKRGRPPEPRTRMRISADAPALATPAGDLLGAITHPDVLAWLAEQRGRGLNCPRSLEVEIVAGRKPRVVLVSAR